VLGLSYKPDTTVVEGSEALRIADSLATRGARVMVYDPVAMSAARKVLGDRVIYAESVRKCLDRAKVVVIANPDERFRTGAIAALSRTSPPLIFDLWRLLQDPEPKGHAHYQGIGLGSISTSLVSRLESLWCPWEATEPGTNSDERARHRAGSTQTPG